MPVRRFLVVANQTLGGHQLVAEIDNRVAAGAATFHVLVPVVPAGELRFAMLSHAAEGGDITPFVQEAEARANRRLDDELARIRRAGGTATGEIGEPDPMVAIKRVLARQSFDEILLSTLPPGASKWLGMDLPKRVCRATKIPVTVVVAERDD